MSTLNMWFDRDTLAWNGKAPLWADLLPGLSYSIVVANQTDADVTTGDLAIEGADALPDDHCKPDAFTPVNEVADCSATMRGGQLEPGIIHITPENPIKAHSQCAFAIPCPPQFIRVSGAPAALSVTIVVTRVRRSA